MRFLQLFFKWVVVLGVIAGLTVVGFVEIRLRLGAWQLRQEIAGLNRMAAVSSQKDRDACDKLGSAPETPDTKPRYPVAGYQLRFTDRQHYRVELVCVGHIDKPILLYQRQLTNGLQKVAGTGIKIAYYGENGRAYVTNAWVTVAYHWRQLSVGYFKGTLGWHGPSSTGGTITEADVPQTVCAGTGGACCSSLSEVGAGEALPGVTDCVGSCFTKCYERPVVVFFNSDPLMDQTNRTVSLSGSPKTMTFGWEITDVDSNEVTASIEFGDGTVINNIKMKDVVNHTYACDHLPCRYTAELRAVDSEGNALADSRQRKIELVMLP